MTESLCSNVIFPLHCRGIGPGNGNGAGIILRRGDVVDNTNLIIKGIWKIESYHQKEHQSWITNTCLGSKYQGKNGHNTRTVSSKKKEHDKYVQ